MTKEELKHAIDHTLNELDMSDWELEDHVSDKVTKSIKQLEHIRDVLIDEIE